MLEVSGMPSYVTTQLESYVTTPCSVQSGDDDTIRLKKQTTEYNSDRAVCGEVVYNRDGVKSAPPSHFSAQVHQSLTEKLVEDSEQRSLDDSLVFEATVYDDWCEAASGWRHVVPNPKYITKLQQSKFEAGFKKGSGKQVSVRCIDDDNGRQFLCPPWKANVEPVTYRYIPNNGFYRKTKSYHASVREWLAVKKKKSEHVLVTPEVHLAQKTLKKDLDSHFKASADMALPLAQEQQTYISDQVNSVQPVFQHSGKRLPPKEQQLIKSASDLFMENFNSRLSALEKEIQASFTHVYFKRQQEPVGGAHHSPLSVTRKIKDATRVPHPPKSTARGTQEGAKISDDLFTVTHIVCKPDVPLQPLEKLTPKQKLMDQKPTSSADRTLPHVHSVDNETKLNLASATSQPTSTHQVVVENLGINTARSAITTTNTDIEKMRMLPFMERNLPQKSHFQSRPKSFLMQQGHAVGSGPTTRKGAMRYTTHQPQQQAVDQGSVSTAGDGVVNNRKPVVARTQEKEIDRLGGSLPEIMCKRMTVMSTTHRLL